MSRFRLRTSVALVLIALIAIVYLVVAFLQGRRPEVPPLSKAEGQPPGYATVTMIHDLMQVQLDGFGGWLPNDLPLSPGWFVDNHPNFQLGVLQTLRHSTRVLRDNLSRQRTTDAVHKETDVAYTAFANAPKRWAFPSAEGAFRRGNGALLRFRADLGGTGAFYPRADNLIQLVDAFMSELGAVSTQLLRARSEPRVGWLEIDDNFYFAQGAAYAMLGMMRAVRLDFDGVLQDKKAVEIVEQILAALEQTQFEPWVVTNGRRDGVVANHSNNLRVFLDDARQKMGSLVRILAQG